MLLRILIILISTVYFIVTPSDISTKVIVFTTILIWLLGTWYFVRTNNLIKYYVSLFFALAPLLQVILPSVLILNKEFNSSFSNIELATSGLITVIYYFIFVLFINRGIGFFTGKYKYQRTKSIGLNFGPAKYYFYLTVFFFILSFLIRISYPISLAEFHTEIRYIGESQLSFAVGQLKWITYLASASASIFYNLKKTKSSLMLLIFIHALYITYNLFLGNRGDVFSFVMIFGAAYLIVSNKRIKNVLNFKKVFLLLISVILLWQITTFYRNSNIETDSVSSPVYVSFLRRLGNFEILPYIINNNFQNPEPLSLVKQILSPIPSTFNPFYSVLPDAFNGVPSLGYAAALFTGNEGHGRAVPLVAEMIWRFGLLYGIFPLMVFGFIIGRIFKIISIKSPWSLWFLIITLIPQIIFGEDFSAMFWPLIIRLFIILRLLEFVAKKHLFQTLKVRFINDI
jgi:oligosaccharide repeat unit polymerase